MRAVVVILLASLVVGCASMSRTASFGATRLADAKVEFEGHKFNVWVHPKDNSLLVTVTLGGSIATGLVSGLTGNNIQLPKPYWRGAAEKITGPLGCTISDLWSVDNATSWEVAYMCPPGTDLRAVVMGQRARLRRGEGLIAPATP